MKLRTYSIVAALAAAVLAIGAPSASAADGFVSITTAGGYAQFDGFGEVLFVSDERKDGYGVSAELRRADDHRMIASVVDGDGDNNNPNEKNLAIDENTKVQLRMCYVEDLWKVVSCSRWQNSNA